jgi:hypothetical protein
MDDQEREREQEQQMLRQKLAEQRAIRARVLGISLEEYTRCTAEEPDMWLGDDRSLAEQPDELDEEFSSAGENLQEPPPANSRDSIAAPGARICASQTLGPGGVTQHTRNPHVDLRVASALLAAPLTKRIPGAS